MWYSQTSISMPNEDILFAVNNKIVGTVRTKNNRKQINGFVSFGRELANPQNIRSIHFIFPTFKRVQNTSLFPWYHHSFFWCVKLEDTPYVNVNMVHGTNKQLLSIQKRLPLDYFELNIRCLLKPDEVRDHLRNFGYTIADNHDHIEIPKFTTIPRVASQGVRYRFRNVMTRTWP